MKKFIKNGLLLFCFAMCILFINCSPQKRLDRLIQNHPYLAKTDTIRQNKTIEVPGISVDTSFNASRDVNGLYELIDVYREYLDSMKRVKLTSEIKTYILDRNCLQDTFIVTLNNNGFCKLWQSKGVFYYQLFQPKQKINFTVPVSFPKFETTTKYNWVMYWAGVASSFALILLLTFLKSWFKLGL